jgi:hypothetical protein
MRFQLLYQKRPTQASFLQMNKKLLTLFEQYHMLYRNKPDDEELVYFSAKRIEELLTQILLKFFLNSPSSEKDALFDHEKPLNYFSVKISIAQRLGLISQGLAAELQTIRRIKKEFRNRLDCRDLEYKETRILCENLWAPARMKRQPELLNGTFPDTPRGNFELTAVILSSLLENILEHIEETGNMPLH